MFPAYGGVLPHCTSGRLPGPGSTSKTAPSSFQEDTCQGLALSLTFCLRHSSSSTFRPSGCPDSMPSPGLSHVPPGSAHHLLATPHPLYPWRHPRPSSYGSASPSIHGNIPIPPVMAPSPPYLWYNSVLGLTSRCQIRFPPTLLLPFQHFRESLRRGSGSRTDVLNPQVFSFFLLLFLP